MSQREEVDRRRIEQFLTALGLRFKRAGRVYLVGGTTLVWEGLRMGALIWINWSRTLRRSCRASRPTA